MAESTLSHSLFTLAPAAGYELGYQRVPANWSGWNANAPWVASSPDTQLADVLMVVGVGLRLVYTPPPTDPQTPPHRWSFLSPEAVLTTAPGQTDYPLPDDFAGFEGRMTYQAAANQFVTVRKVGVGEVRRLLQTGGGISMRPSVFAETPLPFDGATGQRYAAAFYPTPDQAYALTYRYNRQPQMLSAQQPYPYGGQQYGELYLAAVLAACEQRMMDKVGERTAAFREMLAAAVAADARAHRPEWLGYNGDRSDGRGGWPNYGGETWGWHSGLDLVSYNGASMG